MGENSPTFNKIEKEQLNVLTESFIPMEVELAASSYYATMGTIILSFFFSLSDNKKLHFQQL